MTYEEAKEEVLKAAGDYKNTENLHRIRMGILGKTVAQFKDDISEALTSLSISPETMQFSVANSGQMVLQASKDTSTRYESVFDRIMRAEKTEDIIDYFEQIIKSLIYNIMCRSTSSLKDVQRVCGYGSLVISSITADFVSSLIDKGKQLKASLRSLELENNTYQGYCKRVEDAMTKAACYWLATSMIPKYGMKVSVKDLRTSNTSETTKVRTIKRVAYSNGEPTFYFTDTASILRGKSRIHELETYVLNTPQMFEIAKTLKLERLENIL